MSSVLDLLGGDSDLESEEDDVAIVSKQGVEPTKLDGKNDFSGSLVSHSHERKIGNGAESEFAKVDHTREGDTSDDTKFSTALLFRFIAKEMDSLKHNGKNEKAEALDTAAYTVLGLLRVAVQAASKRQDVDVGGLIFEATSNLERDAANSKERECLLRCADVVTSLLNDAIRRSRCPRAFKMSRAPTKEEMRKEAERQKLRHIEQQLKSRMREGERKQRHCSIEINGGFLARSAEQLRNKQAANKVWRLGKSASIDQLQTKMLTQSPISDHTKRHSEAAFSPPPSGSVIRAERDIAFLGQPIKNESGCNEGKSGVSDIVGVPAEELMDVKDDEFDGQKQHCTDGINGTMGAMEQSSQMNGVLRRGPPIPSISSPNRRKIVSDSVTLDEREMDLTLPERKQNFVQFLTGQFAEVVRKNGEVDAQFVRPTSSQSQEVSCIELGTEQTHEVTTISAVPAASPERCRTASQPSQLNGEQRAPAAVRYADIAYVKVRKAGTATGPKRPRCASNVAGDIRTVRKTAKRVKKSVTFHKTVVTSVRIFDCDVPSQNNAPSGVMDIDGETFRSYYPSGSMIPHNSSQPPRWNAAIFIRKEPISEEVDDFYETCNIGCSEMNVVRNWLVIDSSLDLLDETPFRMPSKHEKFPSTIITRARFPPLLFEQFNAAMTAISGQVGSMNVFLAVSRDVALSGKNSAQNFIDFLVKFAARLMQLHKVWCVEQCERSKDRTYDFFHYGPKFLEAPRVLVVNAPEDRDKDREEHLRTFNAEVEAFVRREAEMDDHLSAFYERRTRTRLRFCMIDWRRICAEVGADTEHSSVCALINHLMINWAVISPSYVN